MRMTGRFVTRAELSQQLATHGDRLKEALRNQRERLASVRTVLDDRRVRIVAGATIATLAAGELEEVQVAWSQPFANRDYQADVTLLPGAGAAAEVTGQNARGVEVRVTAGPGGLPAGAAFFVVGMS
jgi:hypothetical protein